MLSDSGAGGKLPPKREGWHRWVVVQTYVLSDEAIGAAVGGATLTFDHENRLGSVLVCADCALPMVEALQDSCDGFGGLRSPRRVEN